eukprot:461858_1
MFLLLIITSLLAFIGNSDHSIQFVCYTRIFENKWPNCQNLRCWTDPDYFFDAAVECSGDTACIGFSSNGGAGCLKQDQNCPDNGIAGGNNDFWVELESNDCNNFVQNGVTSCYKKVFDNEWPHCSNISCFTGKTMAEIKASCDANVECIGFSYDTTSNGNGCLKKDQLCAENGIASGSNGYYAKCGTIRAIHNSIEL